VGCVFLLLITRHKVAIASTTTTAANAIDDVAPGAYST